jgi:nucleotide-binding universal stress UspA family protein
MSALKQPPAPAQWFQRLPFRAQLSERVENSLGLKTAHPPDLETEPGGTIKRILVPTDFSPRSAEALARAASLARRHDATLTILHVIDINPSAALTHCGPAKDLMRQLWVIGASELSRLKKSLEGTHTRAQTLIVEGLPPETIVENSSGFDLLVIAEPHSKSVWKFFSRHTARRVIEQAQCPLLVVHQETHLVGRKFESKAKVAIGHSSRQVRYVSRTQNAADLS